MTIEKTIFKYQLETVSIQSVELPANAEILTIQAQGQVPCLWAIVDQTEKEKMNVQIEIFGTGHPIMFDVGITKRKYISTFQLYGGDLVFHAFYLTNG
jgi:hypothetical protein